MRNKAEGERLIRRFIPTLKEQPLWRLQRVGSETLDFLYGASERDDVIELRPGVAFCFHRFHSLVQDVVRGAWVRDVRSFNGDLLGETTDRSEFLFGAERGALSAARPVLMNLQHGTCFYCSKPIKSDQGEVGSLHPVGKVSC